MIKNLNCLIKFAIIIFKIVNLMPMVVRDKVFLKNWLIPKMHLKQPIYTCNVCGPFTKRKAN